MESCRNVLVEFVYREVSAQIQKLGSGIRNQYIIEEVVAYALNRLPPMFVSTTTDWHQKRRECLTMGDEINKVVRQALLGVRRDPLREVSPLDDIELANAPYALLRSQKLLGWSKLKWSDLPKALENALENALAKGQAQQNFSQASPQFQKYKSWVNKKSSTTQEFNEPAYKYSIFSPAQQHEYATYLLEANYLVHALERLVIRMAQNRAKSFNETELKFIRLEDVLAQTLNRLPSMYATSTKGLGHLRYYAQLNIGSEVAIIVHDVMIATRNRSYQRIDPLLFMDIRRERESAIEDVSHLLGQEVNWQNLAEAIANALESAQAGKVCWLRSQNNVMA
ncbi:late competence development ComFB family protein [Pseudanabaena mucicola]|uniref:Late competence development ComFB family protein n=1 Tax=Pseudanabaena mucicola FACHB-723 TaxID=2692860 RepID=A0ABR8A1Y1_9CYAN|nr:late competence development ComFB family protein [Pseudanabaena mucicola]MBD2189357.1 late competence development ComFB family protein [Pseudanabaena mucicola FACHB-723]